MPWQRYVSNVAMEIDPATGLFAYGEIVITIPRQQGKTTWLLAKTIHRAVGLGPPAGRRQNILYVAQTRNHARRKFEDEHLPILEASPFRSMFRKRMTNGNEALLWRNGSKYAIESSTEKAGHGETLDEGQLDEAFSQIDDRVEQAMKPAMLTRENAQFDITSTAGTSDSLYLLGKNELGRSLVEAGVTKGVAYFEWRGDPDSDPADPSTWFDCMPSLGCMPTLSLAAQLDQIANFQRTMKAPQFRRAFLNIADTERAEEWQLIPEKPWRDHAVAESEPIRPMAYAVDVNPERSFAAVAAAWRDGDRTRIGISRYDRGTAWVLPYLLERVPRWKPCAIVVDPSGPAGSLIGDLERAGLDILAPSMRESAQACGQFIDAFDNDHIVHFGDAALTSAVAAAVQRPIGDAWRLARRSVTADISPLVAAVLAVWGHGMKAHEVQEYDVLASIW